MEIEGIYTFKTQEFPEFIELAPMLIGDTFFWNYNAPNKRPSHAIA